MAVNTVYGGDGSSYGQGTHIPGSDGYSTCDGDCDDNDASLTPWDGDFDGYSSCSGDCNDGDAALYPGAADVPFLTRNYSEYSGGNRYTISTSYNQFCGYEFA